MNTNSSGDNSRNRETLLFKREVVLKYLAFVKAPPTPPTPSKVTMDVSSGTESTDQDSSDDENKEQDHQVRTITNFLASYNKERQAANEKLLLHGCVFKWLKSFERGELDEWEGMNPLNKPNSKTKKIVEHISEILNKKFPDTARFNKLIRKSPSSPEKYGVLAKRPIPKGTFLGFFDGKLVTDTVCEQTGAKVVLDDFHMYLLDDYSYIDGRSFISSFARYYAWSRDIHKQNVSVHLLTEWSDYNRAVCFIANKDIALNEELVTPVNRDYVVRKKHMRFKKASCGENEATAKEKAFLFVEAARLRRQKESLRELEKASCCENEATTKVCVEAARLRRQKEAATRLRRQKEGPRELEKPTAKEKALLFVEAVGRQKEAPTSELEKALLLVEELESYVVIRKKQKASSCSDNE